MLLIKLLNWEWIKKSENHKSKDRTVVLIVKMCKFLWCLTMLIPTRCHSWDSVKQLAHFYMFIDVKLLSLFENIQGMVNKHWFPCNKSCILEIPTSLEFTEYFCLGFQRCDVESLRINLNVNECFEDTKSSFMFLILNWIIDFLLSNHKCNHILL